MIHDLYDVDDLDVKKVKWYDEFKPLLKPRCVRGSCAASKFHNCKMAIHMEAPSARQACARGWPKLLALGYGRDKADVALDLDVGK